MKIVMAFGTFDVFHKGHESYLKQAGALGEKLIVLVARDETVEKIKGRCPMNNEQDRLEKVRASGLADEVILGDLKNRYASIEKFRPDVLAAGYDQEINLFELERVFEKIGINSEIVKLRSFRPHIYKSSKLKKK